MPFPFSSRIRIIQMFFKVFGAETFQDLGREFGPGDERDLTTFDPSEAFAAGWAKAAPAFHWGTAHVPLCPRCLTSPFLTTAPADSVGKGGFDTAQTRNAPAAFAHPTE
jgi:hypothetical protein